MLALALAILPKQPVIVGAALVGMGVLSLYALLQHPWTTGATPTAKRVTRTIVGVIVTCVGIGVVGWFAWPPHHRHALSEAERDTFEKPLKDFKQPQMSIHLYCAPEDEVDCEYAADLIPLFGEAGWDVANTVNRITLGRPKSGILIGMHGTVKPEDEPKLKWDEGEWTRVRPEQWAVRQAFVNIGIEPDSTSGATVPENQINIYVGREREDESAPTDMTREFQKMGHLTGAK